jgi:hypothetical protein
MLATEYLLQVKQMGLGYSVMANQSIALFIALFVALFAIMNSQ